MNHFTSATLTPPPAHLSGLGHTPPPPHIQVHTATGSAIHTPPPAHMNLSDHRSSPGRPLYLRLSMVWTPIYKAAVDWTLIFIHWSILSWYMHVPPRYWYCAWAVFYKTKSVWCQANNDLMLRYTTGLQLLGHVAASPQLRLHATPSPHMSAHSHSGSPAHHGLLTIDRPTSRESYSMTPPRAQVFPVSDNVSCTTNSTKAAYLPLEV